LDTDLFSVGELAFHLLGQNRGGSEASDQLRARFRAMADAALVADNGGDDVAVTTSDEAAPVNVGKDVPTITNPATSVRRRLARQPCARACRGDLNMLDFHKPSSRRAC